MTLIIAGASVLVVWALAPDVPIWLLIPGIGAVTYVVSYPIAYHLTWRQLLVAVPTDPVLCPRCVARERTDAGWCPGCTEALTGPDIPPPARLTSYLTATAAGATDLAAQYLAPTITLLTPNGGRRVMSRAAFQRAGARARRRVTAAQAEAWNDPEDPASTWMRQSWISTSVLGVARANVRTVGRYRLDSSGLIAEVASYEPLPTADD